MKLLFDQNLSDRLGSRLQDQFPGSLHISEVLARRARDPNIWSYAGDNGFIIATKNSDFRRLSNERGHPPKVIWIRTGNTSVAVVDALRRRHYDEILAFDQDPDRGIIELR